MNFLFRGMLLLFGVIFFGCTEKKESQPLKLWYDEPAKEWTEALPIGNGRIGAMVYGGLAEDHIQFNEETLWTGKPRDYSREGAAESLDEIRKLLFEGKQDEAERIAGERFMGRRSNEENYESELQNWMQLIRNDSVIAFANPDFNDDSWKTMDFPAPEGWERSGFHGLDGSVWVRFSFELPIGWLGQDLILNLGRIRDTDFTYFNGTFINTESNKNAHRRYPIDASLIRKGKNVIAIQILNFYDKGGLVGFKKEEPMMVYPKNGKIEEGVPLDVKWKYLVQNDNPPEYPKYQETYQPFGDLYLTFQDHEHVTHYYRELDLKEAISRVSYMINGVKYSREYFVSAPDQALVVHVKSSKKGSINVKANLTSLHRDHVLTQIDDHTIKQEVGVLNGVLRGTSYLNTKIESGVVTISNNQIEITNADEVTFMLTAATNYVRYDDVSGDPDQLASEDLTNLIEKNYHSIKKNHINEYKSYFDRFSIDFGSSENENLTTDERIKLFASSRDESLAALYVQYSRYLLISSSRPGTRPANLQGIWNDQLTPPWDSKYTTNINLEMNYWPAEVLNLSEMHEPLFQLTKEVAEQGRKTAVDHYGADGWVLHHNTDLWRATAPINNSNHGIWVTGGAWLCHHLWERYLFTQDTSFLREAYPIMKGAAEFFVDFLVKDPKTGYLISTPSNSPENGGLVAGPTMDHQIIRDLFTNCILATSILGEDELFANELKEFIPQIAPNQIGQYGQLQEWLEDKDDPENKHRHVSHLWGVYPGNEINYETPELLEAAKQSLVFRGDEGTGWSLAWKTNLWARFGDGNHAWELVKTLLSPAWTDRKGRGGSYVNLFDAHPPFQIDGNFGAAAGIAEMIIQSQGNEIVIFPALPDALSEGSIRGLKVRGGFEVDLDWSKHKLDKIVVKSIAPNICNIRYLDKSVSFETEPDLAYTFNENLEQ